MILDALLQLASSQAESAITTHLGDNVIDLGASRALGVGEPMGVLFTVDVAAIVADDDEDYTFSVEYATNAAQTTGVQMVGRLKFESGTPAVPALDADLLVAGYQFVIPVAPLSLSASARYLGIRLLIEGTTAGITFTANLVPLSMVQNALIHPQSIVIN